MEFEEAWKKLEKLKDKVRKKYNYDHAQISVDTMMVAMIMQHDLDCLD